MMHWEAWQWVLYATFSGATAVAYTVITFRLKSYDKAYAEGARNKELFQAFIGGCANHHYTHPLFMYMGWFWPLIVFEFTLAVISIMAAISLRFQA